MKIETYRPGVPCWAELTSDDPAAARAFYGALLGWRFADADPANADGAVICALGDSPVGVIELAGDGQPSRWTSYLNVDDIEQTLGRIVAEGGTLVRPPRAAVGGRRVATFTDAAGVVLGLLELGAAQPRVVGEPGALIGGELITDDVEASAAFYRAVFGWELGSPKGPLSRREWLVGGQPIAGLLPRPEAMPPEVPVYWDTWFGSADPDGAARHAPDLGGTLLMGPVDTEHGRLTVLTDPSGAVFSVAAPPPDPRPRSERA
jgi:predicted enzyme related to lactoylglutathione lyase